MFFVEFAVITFIRYIMMQIANDDPTIVIRTFNRVCIIALFHLIRWIINTDLRQDFQIAYIIHIGFSLT